MKTNAKGDTMRIAEVSLKPKDLNNPQKGFSVRVVTKCIDSRDGAPYFPQNPGRDISVEDAIAAGVVTEQEYQQVYSFCARRYEWEPEPKAKEVTDEVVN